MNGEIRQLRRIIERQQPPLARPSLTRSVEVAIPQLVDGPLNSLEEARALLCDFQHKDEQDVLVS